MGIMDWLKRGVSEIMVARPDWAKANLVYKHPEKTLPNKAQVTVMEDEQALFFRDGKIVGILGPGRHTLETSNIRFLSDLVDSFTGGDVYRAEVFFVNTREMTGIRFGGRIGNTEDPKSGLAVETMVHGTFSFRVVDPEKLVIGVVGLGSGDGRDFSGWMKEQVLKTIRDNIGELLVKNKWPLLDVTSGAYTEEIARSVVEGANAKHVASYGVELVRMGNFVISIDEEDAETLKKLYADAAYIRMAGGTQGYQQFAAGKAMMGAGEGMARGGGGGEGGGAGAEGMMGGMGLGVGFGMAQMLQQMNAGAQGASPPAGAGQLGQSAVTCPSCKAAVPPGRFCSQCGQALQPEKEESGAEATFCTQCGKPIDSGARFCPSCGAATS